MEWNTVERAIKTEIDKRTEQKKWASSVGLCQTQTVTSPPREGEPAETCKDEDRRNWPTVDIKRQSAMKLKVCQGETKLTNSQVQLLDSLFMSHSDHFMSKEDREKIKWMNLAGRN